MRIDVHAHYFPNEYLEGLARLGHPGAQAATAWLPPAPAGLEARLPLLDAAGIDCQVISVAALMPYLPRSGDAREAARLANDLYAEACSRHPGRFAAFAAVPLPHVDEAVAELGRCLDTLGMVGVTLGCSVGEGQLDDPRFDPFFAELDRREAAFFLHPVGAGAGPGTADYGLTWILGAPVEDAVAALRLILSGLTTRYYGRIRIIVPHLGGMLPFLLQRLDDETDREVAAGAKTALEERPSAHLRRLWFDTVNSHPPALQCACATLGADRLLLGTDFPFLRGPRFERAVNYIAEAGLTPAEASAISGENAQALLGLPTP